MELNSPGRRVLNCPPQDLYNITLFFVQKFVPSSLNDTLVLHGARIVFSEINVLARSRDICEVRGPGLPVPLLLGPCLCDWARISVTLG